MESVPFTTIVVSSIPSNKQTQKYFTKINPHVFAQNSRILTIFLLNVTSTRSGRNIESHNKDREHGRLKIFLNSSFKPYENLPKNNTINIQTNSLMFIQTYHSRFENMTKKLSKTIKFLGHDVLKNELVLDNQHSLPHNFVFQSSILNVYHKRVMDAKIRYPRFVY